MMRENKLIIIDHYDSFTYTIKNYFETLQVKTEVIKNDDPILSSLETLNPAYLVFSPGAGSPLDAGLTHDIIQQYHTRIPMLGICLGHQCIATAFGGKVVYAPEVMHGKQSIIHHTQQGLFTGVPPCFSATRYHSLMVDESTLSPSLEVTAWTYDQRGEKIIMGLQHKQYPIFGIQYHPEAILTEYGYEVLRNFIKIGCNAPRHTE